MSKFDNSKLDYPLTLDENVFLVGSSWFVFMPNGKPLVERFKMKDRAQPTLDKLNEISRRKGGRPRKKEDK